MKLNIVFVASALAYYGTGLVAARPITIAQDLVEARGFNDVDIDARDVVFNDNVEIGAREVEEDLADVYARAPTTVCTPQLVARGPTEKGVVTAAKAVSKIPIPASSGGKSTGSSRTSTTSTRTSTTSGGNNNNKKQTRTEPKTESGNGKRTGESTRRTESRTTGGNGKRTGESSRRTESKTEGGNGKRTGEKRPLEKTEGGNGKPKSVGGASTRSTTGATTKKPSSSSNTRTSGGNNNNNAPKPKSNGPSTSSGQQQPAWLSEFGGQIPKGAKRVFEFDF